MKNYIFALLLALVAPLALATVAPNPPKTPPTTTTVVREATATATATATANPRQDQAQDQHQSQVQYADSNVTYTERRQAPAVAQGSFAIQGCAVAGNAGGSSTSGAGFLGLAFTPEQCYDFLLAQSYQALGAYEAACEVLNSSKAGQRAKARGVKLPVCAPPVPAAKPEPVVVNILPPPPANAVPEDVECEQRVERALVQCVKK